MTGSRIRRKDLATPAPVSVINRSEIAASGRVSIGDLLQTLPEQGNAINTQVNNGGSGATRVSLRGLGSARTLVLVNGRRFVPGGTGADASVDLNSIPTAAIERIEILKDGASAVYGSDAIGGVVNIITRKKGATELAAFTGTTSRGDGTIYDVNGTTGASAGDSGSFIFSGGFYKQQPVWAADRSFSAVPLAYDATGGKTVSGQPGSYSQGSTTVPAGTFSISACKKTTPAGTPCIGRPVANPANDPRIALLNNLINTYKTSGTFILDPNAPGKLGYRPFTSDRLPPDGGDGFNFQPNNYLVTPQQRISLFASGETRVTSAVRAYVEASYVNRQSKQTLAPEPLVLFQENVPLSAQSVHNPFGVDLTQVQRRLVEFDNRSFTQDIDTIRLVGGLDGTLPEEAGPLAGWFFDASLNFGRTEGTQLKQGNLNRAFLTQALGPSFYDAGGVARCGTPKAPISGCVPLNLFGGPGSITQDQVTPLTFTGNLRGTNQLTGVLTNLTGELFRLLSERPVSLAAGYEYRFVTGEFIPDPLTVAGLTTGNKGTITSGTYHVNEGYAELSVPVISNAPLARDFEATIAARVFDYNTFGTGTTYKLGARWRIIDDLTVRGTYSTGFRAPSISDLYSGLSDSFPKVGDPCRGTVGGGGVPPANCGDAAGNGDARVQLRAQQGGNPGLKPETSKTFTTGVVIEPRSVRNLSITVDYFRIQLDQTISTIGAAVILAGCYPSNPNVAPRYCDLVRRDPGTGQITNIFNTAQNVGQDKTDGFDVAMRYAVPRELGRFVLAFDGTWLHSYKRTLADASVLDGRGNYDIAFFPSVKFVSGVTWSSGGLSAGATSRFASSFTECGSPTGIFSGNGLCSVNRSYSRRIRSYNAWDLFASYTLPSSAGRTTLAAGVNNLFDRQPSTIYNGFTAASDPTAYDFLGRFVYARASHTF